jgi:Transposase
MLLIGVDYHPSFQQIAFFEEETGECGERQLNHGEGEAEQFYRDLQQRAIRVRVGMEATGYSRWFERLLAELGFELWIGDPAGIKAKRVKKQKTDRKDAQLLLRLMREDNFPRIWVPGPENRDLRQLLWHRHRLVQMRTRIMNQLQALAMNEVSLLRFLLVEAAQAATRSNPEWRRRYIHLAMRRHRSIARVAMGRRLAVRLYWMWRNGCAYSPSFEFGSYVGQPGTGHGGQ